MTSGGNCLSGVPASDGLPLVPEFDQDHESLSGLVDQRADGIDAIRAELRTLVAILRDANPAIRVVLAQLIPVSTGDPAKDARPRAQPGDRRAGAGA